jgi:biotin transport system substrate-specific component
MSENFPTNNAATMIDTILPESANIWIYKLALALVGTAFLMLSAKIQVPFYPVPMTMQTFVVLVIGMAFGWKLGGLTVLAYLLEGAVGLPVFAGTPIKGIGLVYMTGPTGGYLVGFLISAIAVGYLAEKGFDRSITKTLVAMVLGTLIIFTSGYIWLANLIGVEKAFQFGVVPFVWGAIFKIGLAAALLPLFWNLIRR